MKPLNKTLKALLLLISYLLFTLLMGTSGVMIIIEYSPIFSFLFAIGLVGCSIFGILIECFSNDYKLKYYFLGKDFKKQKHAYLETHPTTSKEELRDTLKIMKHIYRQHGTVSVPTQIQIQITDTPNRIWNEDNHAFNYGNARDEEKINYIIGTLYLQCETGGGFYRFFEDISSEPFDFEEFSSLIKNSPLFSKELKTLLVCSTHKKVFNIFKGKVMTDEESLILEKFDETDSHKLFDYQTELFNLVEKLSIENYLNLKQKENLPDKTVKAFISKDKTKRVCIYFDQKLNVYKIGHSTFAFYELDISPMNSEGSWSFHTSNSYFASAELALNEIKTEIQDFDELTI